jgi:hypothetical protein
VIVVPLDSINCKIVVLVGFEVLATISLRTEMDITLFSSDQEQVFVCLVKIKTHTACKSVKESLLFIVS